ncbi:MAG: hypothetical protein QG577_2520 [Thermodesulfobacteriota bacterium]|nr:hypothetical protein [Thermodesulfobacteriota bacterium]
MTLDRLRFLCLVVTLCVFLVKFFCIETMAQSSYRGLSSKASASADSSSDDSQGNSENDEDFDLEACQRYCLGSPGGSNLPAGGPVNECIQNCNARYWKSFDKRMNKLGK